VDGLIQAVGRELAGDPPVHLADDLVYAQVHAQWVLDAVGERVLSGEPAQYVRSLTQ
jgi:hypothetical protein